jgi:hypothetical protein
VPDLHAIVRIKTMAQAAAMPPERPSIDASIQVVGAYERLREDARGIYERAGWGSAEDFDRELPPLEANMAGGRAIVGAGDQARVLLGQLAAWAAGHQEAFEIEERMRATAEAKARESGKFGFSPRE